MSKNVSLDQVREVGRELAVDAAEGFRYPGDTQDPVTAGEWVIELFEILFPVGEMTGDRKRKVAYRRLCACAWCFRPELTGCKTANEMAEEIGISARQFQRIRKFLSHAVDPFESPFDINHEQCSRWDLDTLNRLNAVSLLFSVILPSGGFLTGRKKRLAAYRRFCVLAWHLRPELTQCDTVEALADELGITKWAVYKIRDEILPAIFGPER